jgi:membrane protease YdiL (CAAX protease family)
MPIPAEAMTQSPKHGIPPTLLDGAVKAHHVIILYAACLFISIAFALPILRTADADIKKYLSWVSIQALAAGLMFMVALIVPEMRRSLTILYSKGRERVRVSDACLFLAVSVTWAVGMNMLLINLPLLMAKPDLFGSLGYHSNSLQLDYRITLLFAIASMVIAPIGEEFLFRGMLLNLWMDRFGLWPGILLSSFAFAVIHGPYAGFAGVAGIFDSLVYLRYRSLVPVMLLHATYNLIAFPTGPLSNLYFTKDPARITDLSSWSLEFLAALLFIPCFVAFLRRFKPGA